MNIEKLQKTLEQLIPEASEDLMIPGCTIGIQQGDERFHYSWGTANPNTGLKMAEDTRWILGSITKVMTAQLLLGFVEDGLANLDDPVVKHLPEFELSDPKVAAEITLKQLINHTNGMNADTLLPDIEQGDRAVASYLGPLSKRNVLFEPGTAIHYSNPGFAVAASVIEKLSGLPFNLVFQKKLYEPLQMAHSCTSATSAILEPVAIGTYPDPATRSFRATKRFMLPESAAGAGSTPIVSTWDMLKFGRAHLDALNGRADDAAFQRIASQMAKPTFDFNSPNAPEMGLGWWRMPIGGTTALWHGGGSPGGCASLTLYPELDLVITGFANSAAGSRLHDAIINEVLSKGFNLTLESPWRSLPAEDDPTVHVGTYTGFEAAFEITESSGALQLQEQFIPLDKEQDEIFKDYIGGAPEFPAVPLRCLARGLYGPASATDEELSGVWGRLGLVSFHNLDRSGQSSHLHHKLRLSARKA